jgi:hypothetical protein
MIPCPTHKSLVMTLRSLEEKEGVLDEAGIH